MTATGTSVLLTGAANGIGAEVGRRLAGRGARVALVDRATDELAGVAAECAGSLALEADVRDRAALDRAAEAAVTEFGGIDVVVANAGIGSPGFIRTVDPETFERILDVDLLGVWRTVRACLPHVVERRGYVLLVSSVAALFPGPGLSAYTAAKAGVESMGEALRLELAPFGVQVGIAYFTWVDTPMIRGARPGQLGGSMRMLLRGPLGRTHPVEDVAEAVVRGIERRSRIVAHPPWIRALIPLRPLLLPAVELRLRGKVAEYDRIAERVARSG
jgi:NAD(P)-dependent dehydrogenase (short-subunit alcohol dehydrogenase family)